MTKNNQKRLIIFFIVIFGLIASGYNSFLKPLDSMIINFIQGLENPVLTSIYLNTTNIADQKPSAIVMAFIKIIFNRPRPNIHRLVELNSLSFPSGHTTSATIMYLTLALIFIKLSKKGNINYFPILIAIIGILFIATSRVYLGVHYPTDTMAGMCLGSVIVLTHNLIYYNKK